MVTSTTACILLENFAWNAEDVIANYEDFGKTVLFTDVGIPYASKKNAQEEISQCSLTI
jgi:hypothetical protein